MDFAKIILKPKKEESLRRFHPWVFSGAIQKIIGKPQEGDIVDVYTAQNEYCATGHYQIGSIAVRVLSFEGEHPSASFWEKRITEAYLLRKTLGRGSR